MTVEVRSPVLSHRPKVHWPAEFLAPNGAIQAVISPPPAITNLAQLQLEFDAAGIVRKRWPQEALPPNLAVFIVAVANTPPPLNLFDGLPRKRFQGGELPPQNIAVLPTQAPGLNYDYPSVRHRIWPLEAAPFNVLTLPDPTVIPPFAYQYPAKPRFRWMQDAPFPNVASQPVGTVIPPFSYQYPAKARFRWPLEAALPNIAVLPTDTPPPGLHEWPVKPKRRWPDNFQQPNVLAYVPITQPAAPGFHFDYPSKPRRFWPDPFVAPYPRLTATVPIYIPLQPGFVIYLPPRTFTLAALARQFSLSLPPRLFVITTSMQTFEIKDPAESWPLTFNMASNLGSGETLVGAPTVTVTTVEGIDLNPTAILNAPAGFDPTLTQVIQPVTAGSDGCEYEIVVTCPTSNPLKTLTLVGVLPVRRA